MQLKALCCISAILLGSCFSLTGPGTDESSERTFMPTGKPEPVNTARPGPTTAGLQKTAGIKMGWEQVQGMKRSGESIPLFFLQKLLHCTSSSVMIIIKFIKIRNEPDSFPGVL